MIETLKNTKLYKSLNLNQNLHHAYLLHSIDKELNNAIANIFAKSILCASKNACGVCTHCKQFSSLSHPDCLIINQQTVKVEDVNNLVSKLNTKPISTEYKVFVILNAENINEIAQNKLLKSLEEPNPSNIFILTTSKIDKLLPTVLSRLHKVTIPKLSTDDFKTIHAELNQNNIDIGKYLNTDFNLTDILNYETNESYKKTLNAIKYVFENLKSSQDIPHVASSLPEMDKTLFLPILQKLFMSCINNQAFCDEYLSTLIKTNYPVKALINCLPLIEDSFKKQSSNVNFGYILDNLLFNILKEKFLCKQ